MRKAALVLVPTIYFICMTCHADASAGTQAPMQFAAVSEFSLGSSKFDLTATDSDDDCGGGVWRLSVSADPIAADAPDTIVLARLDTDKKNQKNTTAAARLAGSAKAVLAPASPAPRIIDAVPVSPTWEIVVSDKTLNAALARWAAIAGWQLLWELPVDYAVEARTTVPGSFEEAVSTVAKSMETAEIPIKAIFYQGNKVLRIMAKGVE